jgi:hypothetical protein
MLLHEDSKLEMDKILVDCMIQLKSKPINIDENFSDGNGEMKQYAFDKIMCDSCRFIYKKNDRIYLILYNLIWIIFKYF